MGGGVPIRNSRASKLQTLSSRRIVFSLWSGRGAESVHSSPVFVPWPEGVPSLSDVAGRPTVCGRWAVTTRGNQDFPGRFLRLEKLPRGSSAVMHIPSPRVDSELPAQLAHPR